MVDMRTTRWEAPCGCIVEYDWDHELPESSRVHRIVRVLKTGASHEGKLQIGQDPFRVLV